MGLLHETFTRKQQIDSISATSNPVQFVLLDEHSGHAHQIHNEDFELEVMFDFFKGNFRIIEKARDEEIWPATLHKEVIYFNRSNSSFLNLEGLSDNSILLTFRSELHTQADFSKKLKVCHQSLDFASDLVESPLRQAILYSALEERIFCFRIPKDRHRGWKTIALILLTYREITPKIWHRMVVDKSLRDVAGFDWRHISEMPPAQLSIPIDLDEP